MDNSTNHHTSNINGMKPKGIRAAYALQLWLGGVGAHRFYLKKIGSAILFIVTLGGLGIWYIIDLFRMKSMVQEVNDKRGFGRIIPNEGMMPKVLVGLGILVNTITLLGVVRNLNQTANKWIQYNEINASNSVVVGNGEGNDNSSQNINEPIEEVLIDDIMNTYDTNELQGDKKYKNKTFTILGGTVNKVATVGDSATVKLDGTEWRLITLDCALVKDDYDKALDLSEGDEIIIQGKITGQDLMGFINVKQCSIVE